MRPVYAKVRGQSSVPPKLFIQMINGFLCVVCARQTDIFLHSLTFSLSFALPFTLDIAHGEYSILFHLSPAHIVKKSKTTKKKKRQKTTKLMFTHVICIIMQFMHGRSMALPFALALEQLHLEQLLH